MNLNEIGYRAHKNARDKGFWNDIAPVPVKLALIHSEISEALEADRNGIPDTAEHGLGEELADAIIRIMDLAHSLALDMDSIVERKMQKNESRPQMHGGKAY